MVFLVTGDRDNSLSSVTSFAMIINLTFVGYPYSYVQVDSVSILSSGETGVSMLKNERVLAPDIIELNCSSSGFIVVYGK